MHQMITAGVFEVVGVYRVVVEQAVTDKRRCWLPPAEGVHGDSLPRPPPRPVSQQSEVNYTAAIPGPPPPRGMTRWCGSGVPASPWGSRRK